VGLDTLGTKNNEGNNRRISPSLEVHTKDTTEKKRITVG